MSQPSRPPNTEPNFAFSVEVSNAVCPTPKVTSRDHLYNRIEDDGGQKTERDHSVTKGLWPCKLDAFLSPFQR